jgi:acyl-CoA dehydrogenase
VTALTERSLPDASWPRSCARTRGSGRTLVSQRSRRRQAVAEIAVELEASRCLTYHALGLFAAGHNAVREVTEAKLLSQRAAFRVAESAFACSTATRRSRVLRDTRLGPIGGGTDEVMKEILGKQLGL